VASPFETAAPRPPKGEGRHISPRLCEERLRRSNPSRRMRRYGLLRGACHRARIRATRWLAMTAEHDFMISRHELPEICIFVGPLENRGRREDRVRAAPAVSCAMCTKEHAHEHTGPAESIICHRHRADTSARLDASLGRQDHTTSPYASCAFVFSRMSRPPLPAPYVRDDRDTPLFVGTGWGEVIAMICPTGRVEYFSREDWTSRRARRR